MRAAVDCSYLITHSDDFNNDLIDLLCALLSVDSREWFAYDFQIPCFCLSAVVFFFPPLLMVIEDVMIDTMMAEHNRTFP